MAITKEKKAKILEKVQGIVADNETITFVNFKGLGVLDTTEMRGKLREEGVGYTVAKKTLVKRVLDEAKVEGEMPELTGELALAYGPETEPARGVYDFAKGLGEESNLEIVGGIFEGRYMDKAAMTEIATIPGLQVLRGMFVNVINSPIQGLAVALGQIAEKKDA